MNPYKMVILHFFFRIPHRPPDLDAFTGIQVINHIIPFTEQIQDVSAAHAAFPVIRQFQYELLFLPAKFPKLAENLMHVHPHPLNIPLTHKIKGIIVKGIKHKLLF